MIRKSRHFLPQEAVRFATLSLSLERSKLRQERKDDDPYIIEFFSKISNIRNFEFFSNLFRDP